MNVELVDTSADYLGSIDKVVARELDTNGFWLFDLVKFNAQGAGLVMVINSDNSFGSEAIVAKPGIKSLKDLQGKTIGVSKNSYMEYILGIALTREGISLSDLTLENMLTENAVKVFSKPSVDAVMVWEPLLTEIIQKHNGRRVFDTSEVPGISPNGQVFHRDFIKERPGDVQAFVNVWHKTTQFIKENPKEAFGIIAQIYKQTPGEVQAFAQADRILDLRDNLTTFSFGSGFESLHGSVRKVNDFLIEKGMTKEQLDSTEILDARFIQTLKKGLS